MLYSSVICQILLLAALGGPLPLAAATRVQAVPEKSADVSAADEDDARQRRRAGLRKELRVQNAGSSPAPQRQLSPQDRADLRQQLREQPRQPRRDDNRQ